MDTVILTVYNRPDMTLLNTFHALRRNDLTDTEILVIDDGSTEDYEGLREMVGEWLDLRWIRRSTIEERPNTYHIDGHNNPAWVNNVALREARGDRLFWLSSDVVLPPTALLRARSWDLGTTVMTPRVVDMDTGEVFLGRERVFPMCWFVATTREHCLALRGFDEIYCDGMAFEDNDFMGRLALHAGKLVVDQSIVAFHQSHPPVAYSDDLKGYRLSEAYTLQKWGGGVPFAGNASPVKFKAKEVGKAIMLVNVTCQESERLIPSGSMEPCAAS